MKSKKGVKLRTFLMCLTMILAGFAVGINVGSQLLTERPDFLTAVILGVVVLCCIILPSVNKKEKAQENKE